MGLLSRDRSGKRSSRPLGAISAALLGVAAALLVSSCGNTGKGLIPTGNAGPLQSDFEAVAQAAQSGNGSCAGTAAAIRKTEQDFAALPTTIDAGLRNTLRQGIANLHTRALVLCAQPLPQATVTSPPPSTTTQPKTTTTNTTPTVTQTTPPQTTPTVTTPTTPEPAPTPGGGTPAPGAGGGESPSGAPSGQGGGTGAGENATPGDGSGSAGSGAGREGGK